MATVAAIGVLMMVGMVPLIIALGFHGPEDPPSLLEQSQYEVLFCAGVFAVGFMFVFLASIAGNIYAIVRWFRRRRDAARDSNRPPA